MNPALSYVVAAAVVAEMANVIIAKAAPPTDMRALILGTVLYAAVFLGLAKSQTTTKKSPSVGKKAVSGEMDGFVFAITNGGDLKPARLAHIVLLYLCRNGLGPNEEFPESAAYHYNLCKVSTGTGRALGIGGETNCRTDLQDYIAGLKLTTEWALAQKKYDQVKTTDADEEGRFKLTDLVPGEYTLTALGQAGANTAYWEEGNIVVQGGKVTSVKLSSPKTACPIKHD